MSEKNLRIFHGKKVSKGRRQIRRNYYPIRPGDMILYEGKKYVAKGMQNVGTRVLLADKRTIPLNRVKVIRHTGGWV